MDARYARSRGGRSGFGVARGDGVARAAPDKVRLGVLKQRRRGHDPGRVVRDLVVMLADGGECLADLGSVREQEELFGRVASDSTAFRVIDGSLRRRGWWPGCARRTPARAPGSGSCTVRRSG
jgi:hypothetical protein